MNKEKEAIMKDKIKNILDITFWKFVLVGIVNTLVGTAVMFAAYNVLHLSYWISSASNYVVGSIVSYFLNKYFTFQNKEKSWKQLVKFALNITVCYLVAYGLTVQGKGKSFGSGYTCWYYTQFYGNYLFHSVLYKQGSMSVIIDGRLGINASHGCVRLNINNAKWIYDNIPRGTKVVVY